MLEYLWHNSLGLTILLSSLVVSSDVQINSNFMYVNTQIRALAKRMLNEHKRIVFVDMSSDTGPQVGCLVDSIHPNDEGYKKMVRLWAGAVLEALRNGFLNNVMEKGE